MTAPRSILMVEDNRNDVQLMQLAMEDLGVATPVEIAEDGVAATAQLARRAAAGTLPDLVLLDLNLPRLDGLGVLRWIRAQPFSDRVRVIVLTTSSSPHDIEATTALGIAGYEVKPSRYDDLVKLADKLMKA